MFFDKLCRRTPRKNADDDIFGASISQHQDNIKKIAKKNKNLPQEAIEIVQNKQN